jgi:hypothetical protein
MEVAILPSTEEAKAMKRMCAWCGRELDQVERRDNQPLTHGLCPECRRQFFPVATDQDTASLTEEKGVARVEPGGATSSP